MSVRDECSRRRSSRVSVVGPPRPTSKEPGQHGEARPTRLVAEKRSSLRLSKGPLAWGPLIPRREAAVQGLSVADLPADLRERIVSRLRGLEPDAVAVLAHGSYARGLATPSSDLDLAVLLDGPGRVHYRTWFEEQPDGRLLHVSANTGVTSDVWKSWSEEPQDWAFGFPVTVVHAWVWVTKRAKELIGDPPVLVRPAE